MDSSKYEGSLLTDDEAQIDLHDLLGSHIDVIDSPIKRQNQANIPALGQKLILGNPRLALPPVQEDDLFEVTNEMAAPKNDIFGVEESFLNQQLNHDKIDKLMRNLEQDPDFDYELDDQGRTRIFKGRFKNFNVEQDETFDSQLSQYLNNNKENHYEPTKRAATDYKVKKPMSVLKNKKNNNTPILKPLNTLTNAELKRAEAPPPSFNDASKRVCKPKHRLLQAPARPSMVHTERSNFIYWVDSSTGSINDATQFGTELNASNCEGFPLPEDVNEIVQIPTNEEVGKNKKKTKAAIIKAFRNSHSNTPAAALSRTGFYSKEEYQRYLSSVHITQQTESGVEVACGTPEPTRIQGSQEEKKLRFASELEW